MALKRINPDLVGLTSAAKKVMKTANDNSEILLNVPIEEVESKEQVRKTFKNIDELAQSIKEIGLQQPITVQPKNASGKYVIIQGERRWRACKEAGLKEIRVIVKTKYASDIDRTIAQLTENIQRDDMDPVELGRAFKEVIAQSKAAGKRITADQLSAKLGKSQGWVSAYMQVADLPEYLEAIRQKTAIGHKVLQLMKRALELDSEFAQASFDAMMQKGEEFTYRTCTAILNEIKEKQGKKKTQPANDATGTTPKAEPVKEKRDSADQESANEKEAKDTTLPVKDVGGDAGEITITQDEPRHKPESLPKGTRMGEEIVSMVLVTGREDRLGYLAPNLLSMVAGHVCVVLDGIHLLVPIEEVMLLGTVELADMPNQVAQWEKSHDR